MSEHDGSGIASGEDFRYSDEQRLIAKRALDSPVSVITGNAGTGKTTVARIVIGEYLRRFPEARVLGERDGGDEGGSDEREPGYGKSDLVVAAVAFTGVAAKRFSQVTRFPARTIHRLLSYDPAEGKCRYSGRDRLREGLYVLDEASLVPSRLMAALLAAIPRAPGTRVVMVGDPDQLPPVGAGDPFREYMASEGFPVWRLSTVFRHDPSSRGILENAMRVLRGEAPVDGAPGYEEVAVEGSGVAMEREVERAVRSLFLEGFRSDDVQVLATTNDLVWRLNNRLKPVFNEREAEDAADGAATFEIRRVFDDHKAQILRFRMGVGDRVINTENDYYRDVMNGEIGVVVGHVDADGETVAEPAGPGGAPASPLATAIARALAEAKASARKGEESVLVAFPDNNDLGVRVVSFPIEYAKEQLDLAYAITVHKAQGSEFPAVVVALPRAGGRRLNTRRMLYTAITRAKKRVVVVAESGAIEDCVFRGGDDEPKSRIRAYMDILRSGDSIRFLDASELDQALQSI